MLVGISGGPDSTALLWTLVRLAPRLKLAIEAATVDHGLRPEAEGEARAVAETCRKLGVRCEVVRVDVRAARARHVSWQDAARRARLAALEAVADKRRCTKIALGHTADDQAETVLFRIVRGTGVRGLAGIPYVRDRLVRPLLDVRRADIVHFLRKQRAPFIEDPSNLDPRFARSRVRHVWIPFLARENPRITEALLALAAEARIWQLDHPAATGPTAPLPAVASRRAAATVARLMAEKKGTRLVSVEGGTIEVSYGAVSWRPADDERRIRPSGRSRDGAAAFETRSDATVPVWGPGIYRLADGQAPPLEVRVSDGGRSPSGVVCFDADALAWPLCVRRLRPGDRMRPRGGRGSRKLSDLLVDAKIPRLRRAQLPVLVDALGHLLFVPGLRPSDIGRPGPGTTRAIEVHSM